MAINQTNPYLKTKILTATPEELRLMLYEGALKFCHQSVLALEQNDYDGSYNTLMRAQRIVMELSSSLNHKQAPELCERLSALYTYIYRRLIDANFSHEVAAVQEAIKLLEFEKQTWKLLMNRLNDEGYVRPAGHTGQTTLPAPEAQPTHAQRAQSISDLSVRVG